MHILCPHCHNPIEVVRFVPREEIACPSCGSSFHLEAGSTTGGGMQTGQKVGKFEVIDTLGHGAFGTVYKARDPELDRTVAVKVPRAGSVAGAQELDRFLREGRSAAQLRHPSIVSVHEVGQADGLPYIVSDFVQGVTLADLLSARRPSFRDAAEMIAAVADALQYAHERDVIHRDIKPSNIMIGDDGRPAVMDFGLAKREAGEITMTVEGQVLGTPAYMSPEQARGEGHTVDGRSDVYSLGVVLYELLTGELPFRGTQRMLLLQVLQDEPRPPRRLNDKIPRDLETICLKAMAKEPGRRYATARDLADDLRRWLKGEAIRARPSGRWERGARWARRHPAAAAAYGLLVVLLVVGFGGGGATWLWLESEQARGAAVKAKGRAEQAQSETEKARAALEGANDALLQAKESLKVANRRLTEYSYADQIYLAQRDWELGAVQPARQRLKEAGDLLETLRPGPRPWEWDYLNRLFHPELAVLEGHTHWVWCVSFSADGRRLATGSADYTARLWDAESGKPLTLLKGHMGGVHCVAFSPDGRRVATASDDASVRLWDAETGKQVVVLAKHEGGVRSVAFSPDGSRIATAGDDRTARLWDAASGKQLAVLEGHTDSIHCVAFSPDGRRVATAGEDRTARVWDVESGKQLAVLEGHTDQVNCVVFSPDGDRIATASRDQTTRLWDPASGRSLVVLQGPGVSQLSVAFSPDGHRIATAGCNDARLWRAREIPADQEKRRRLWREQQAADAEQSGQWFSAAFHLSRLIDAEPADAALYARRAWAEVRLARWREAAEDLLRGAALQPEDDAPMPRAADGVAPGRASTRTAGVGR